MIQEGTDQGAEASRARRLLEGRVAFLRDQLAPARPLRILDVGANPINTPDYDLLLTRQPRYLPQPSLLAFKDMQPRSPDTLRAMLVRANQPNHILWAACRDSQTSADALLDGKWHGAFTYFLCRELESAKGDLTRRELLKRVRAQLAANEFTQVPQLEYKATLRGNF